METEKAKSIAVAEAQVFVKALVLATVFYGVYSLVSGAVFAEPGTFWVVSGVALALTAATNVVFLYARERRPELLNVAETVQDRAEGRAGE